MAWPFPPAGQGIIKLEPEELPPQTSSVQAPLFPLVLIINLKTFIVN
ncbi:MAG: hypothetical protein OP8BY_1440 [Candidatus Saccharicenans subterraneus]|uniref:Uncharacterized protein n=1 Tax=Candidatus Saccharicenans subterraneus TaxID=2508984 RepID=A0A3E2BJL9_9BACT|nr:MAG: hypothetical protein OP8BY_1440 [Candidatus Saccharicenans subterraneum]